MLRFVLVVNAFFSLLSGLTMIIGYRWLSLHIPMPNALWMVVGFGLVLFALQLFGMVVKPQLAQRLIKPVVLLDFTWVVITTIALLILSSQVSTVGMWIILLVNITIGSLGYMQHIARTRH